MTELLSLLLRGASRLLVAFALIVAGLLLVQWVRGQWIGLEELQRRADAARAAVAELQARSGTADAELRQLTASLDDEVAALVARRSKDIQSTIEALGPAIQRVSQAATEAARTAASARDARRAANRAWNQIPWYARREALAPFSEQGRAWSLLEARAIALEAAQQRADAALRGATAVRDVLVSNRDAAQRALEADVQALRAARGPALARAQQVSASLSRELAAQQRVLDEVTRRVDANPLARVLSAVRDVLPAALVGLLLWLAVPFAWKVVAYYGIARWVASRPPVRLDGAEAAAHDTPTANASGVREAHASGVSVEVAITRGEQLVVKSAYLQSAPRTVEKRTIAVLSRRYWLSSFTAGMFLPTRLTTTGPDAATVRVTATDDVLGELCPIDVPEGAALILRPSSLAGVVHARGAEVPIHSRWRLGSLHAWCSWQLRFLEFRGPCRLIVKGTRGVRVERVDGRELRQINGDATLGFSPSTPFRVTRTETFVPYVRGLEPLFNDLFGPGPGVIVYEERPSGRDGARVAKALTSWFDAFRQGLGI